jgi:outer membrane lipoprotein-sorting protein
MPVQRRSHARVRWSLALACLLCVAAAAPRPASADLFDDLYQRGQRQNGELRTFTASFTESTTSTLLTRPLVARGTVAVERPARIALRYTDPEERAVIIDGDRMTLWWPGRKLVQTRDIGAAQRRVRRYFVDSSPAELRSHFEIAAAEARDRPGFAITLVPKRSQIREGLASLDLWVDPGTLLLSGMRMTFPNGDTKTMTFADVKPNAAIDPAAFVVAAGAR